MFKIDDIDVNRILVSKKEPYSTKKSIKYFIGYSDNDVIRHTFEASSNDWILYDWKCFDSSKRTSLKLIDKKLLKMYTKRWERES